MSEEVLECGIKVILDFCILCVVFVPIAILHYLVDPFQRGFYCDDQSISHPYKNDTVPILECAIIGAVLIVILVPVIELVRYLTSRKKYALDNDQVMRNKPSQPHYQIFGHKVHIYAASLYKIIGIAIFGYFICQLTTDIIKKFVGRLRPHFLTVCKPDWSSFNCTDSFNFPVYVEANICTTSELHKLKEARVSFPSGHSSFITYMMVFMILYLQSSFKWKRAPILLRPLLQSLCLFTMVYVCVSRISDYKHHWSDVLGGAIIGLVTSVGSFSYVSDIVPSRKRLSDLEITMSELRPTSSEMTHGGL